MKHFFEQIMSDHNLLKVAMKATNSHNISNNTSQTLTNQNGGNSNNDYHVLDYEITSNGEEDNIHEWTEHINKLKEIQMIIDDEVKGKVDDGAYLKIMDGLGGLYKMYQR